MTALPSLELDARDLADLDAGDVDRLALARRDRLGGRHLGLDLEEVLADDGTHAGSASRWLAEDHDRDDRATTISSR